MTTHFAAFSLRADSVWRAPLRAPGPPWSLVETAAVRFDMLMLDWGPGMYCQGVMFLCAKRGLGMVSTVLEADQIRVPGVPVSTYRIAQLLSS